MVLRYFFLIGLLSCLGLIGKAQKLLPKDDPRYVTKPVGIWTLDWSPEDRYVAFGGDDRLIRVYDGMDFDLLQVFETPHMVRQVKWHPTNPDLLAIASGGNDLSILNLATKQITLLRGVQYGARAIGWNHNGTMLATADGVGLIKIWKVDGTLLKTIPKEDRKSYLSLDWHPSKDILVVSGDNIRLVDTTGKTLQVIKHRTESTGILAVRWHPSGAFFASGDYGHEGEGVPTILQFWKSDGTLIKTIHGSKAEIRNLAWSKDGAFLATASDALRIWSKEGKLLYTGQYKKSNLWGIQWNAKAKHLVTTSFDGHFCSWDEQARLMKVWVDQ